MSGSVWYISFDKKKIEFKKYPKKKKPKKKDKEKSKKSVKKNLSAVFFVFGFILLIGLVSAQGINDTFHINIQTTFSNGSIQEGTFNFEFNITENSTSTSCGPPVVYNHSTSLTTDSRGIVSLYLPTVGSGGGNLSALDFDKQYYLCYTRDGTLKDVSQLGRVPYSFRATQVNLSEVDIDSNLNLTNEGTSYNITGVNYGFFSNLGNLLNRITSIFVQDINASGDINISGIFRGNGSGLTDVNSDTLDGFDSTFFMPLNTSVVGNFSFNGGWENEGLSIIDGDIYAQTGFFYNITSLNVTKQNLTINDNLLVLGNTDLRQNLTVDSGTLFVNSNTDRVGIGTTTPQTTLHVAGNALFNGTINTDGNKIINIANGTNSQDAVTYSQLQAIDAEAANGTGTINTVAKWTGSSTLGNSLITDDGTIVAVDSSDLYVNTSSGNVGIGTTTPQNKLDVRGSISTNDGVRGTLLSHDTAGSGRAFLILDSDSADGIGIGSDYLFIVRDGNAGIINSAGGAGTLSLQTAATNALFIDSSQNVGIGTSSPGAKLEVKQTAVGDALRISGDLNTASKNAIEFNSTAGAGHLWSMRLSGTDADAFAIVDETDGRVPFFIDTSGNVGIGTTSPSSKLHISSADFQDFIILDRTQNVNVDQQIFLTPSYAAANETALDFNIGTTNQILRLTESGNVGIGTSNPASLLNLKGINPRIRIDEDNTGRIGIFEVLNETTEPVINIWSSGATSTEGEIKFSTGSGAGTERVRIDGSGNVGIGTTSPNVKLDINPASDALRSGLNVRRSASTTQYGVFNYNSGALQITAVDTSSGLGAGKQILFNQANSTESREIARFDAGGNFGIGTTAPAGKFVVSNNGNQGFEIFPNNTDNTNLIINFDRVAGIYTNLQTRALSHQFLINASEVARIDSSGNVGIGTTSPQNLLQIHTATSNNHLLLSGTAPGIKFSDVEGGTEKATLGLATANGNFVPTSSINDTILRTVATDGDILFVTGTSISERMRITDSGNVGIGTTSPSSALDVNGDVLIQEGTNGRIDLQSEGGGVTIIKMGVSGRIAGESSIFRVGALGRDLRLTNGATGQTDRLTILNSNGNVGIGTTSPTEKLHLRNTVSGTNTLLEIDSVDAHSAITFSNSTTDFWDIGKRNPANSDRFYIFDQSGGGGSGSEVFTILKGGNVGIGTTSPGGLLTLGEDDGQGSLANSSVDRLLLAPPHHTGSDWTFSTRDNTPVAGKAYLDIGYSSPVISLDAGGNVGIGTTTPQNKLNVIGDGNFTGTVYANGAALTSSNGDITSVTAGSGLTGGGTSGDVTLNVGGSSTISVAADSISVASNSITDTHVADNSLTALSLAANSVGNSELFNGGTWSLSSALTLDNSASGQIVSFQGGVVDTAYEWLGFYSGTTRQGIIIYDGAWTGCTNVATDFCFVAENSQRLVLQSGTTEVLINDNLNMNNNDITSVDKLTANTIDPIYNIDGERYATYLPGMVGGVKEEVTGTVMLNSDYTIDFDELEEGSDLWLFYQATDFGKEMENLQIVLTAGFDGRVWYEKNPNKNTLTIKGTQAGEVSYRFTANRFDHEKWSNIASPDDPSTGLVAPLK